MGARQKLNTAYVNGALIVAGTIGLAADSWLVFLVILAVSLGCACHSGDIRPTARR